MPDLKFASSEPAARYCNAPDYPEVAKSAIKEMHRQVGDLVINGSGIAVRGLLVRHLVMPDNLAGTRELMEFLTREISKNTYVNIMSQYHPSGRAHQFPELNRTITDSEYARAIQDAIDSGLNRLDQRRARLFRWF
jgi:putative pyruvate formate lyase activating enzyme